MRLRDILGSISVDEDLHSFRYFQTRDEKNMVVGRSSWKVIFHDQIEDILLQRKLI
jgi:hypothetical protein